MNERYTIDRFEGKYVICEDKDGNLINIYLTRIFGNVKSGIVIIKREDSYYVDEEATLNREKKIERLMDGMWED